MRMNTYASGVAKKLASSRRMMMPTVRIEYFVPLAGDGAKHFVEPTGLQVQLLEFQSLARGKFGQRRQDGGAGAGQRREAAIALANLDRSHLRQRRHGGARGGQLRGLLELHGYRVVVARARGKTCRAVVGDDAAARDDDRARAHRVDL